MSISNERLAEWKRKSDAHILGPLDFTYQDIGDLIDFAIEARAELQALRSPPADDLSKRLQFFGGLIRRRFGVDGIKIEPDQAKEIAAKLYEAADALDALRKPGYVLVPVDALQALPCDTYGMPREHLCRNPDCSRCAMLAAARSHDPT